MGDIRPPKFDTHTSWCHDELLRCPVCNRLPRVRVKYRGGIAFSTARCPSILKKPHITTTAYSENDSIASIHCAVQWNNLVEEIQREHEQSF